MNARRKSPLLKIIMVLLIFLGLSLLIGGLSAYLFFAYFAKSEAEVKVPDLMGKDFVSAFELLSKQKLAIKKTPDYSSQADRGLITGQYPTAGASIKKGRTVELKVSEGPSHIEIPSFRNKSLLEAQNVIRALSVSSPGSIKLGKVSYAGSSKNPRDTVISQDPPPGTILKSGVSVNLLLSSGIPEKKIIMPDLIGMNIDQAAGIIEKIGIELRGVNQKPAADIEENIVMDQYPAGGAIFPLSEPVDITVSVYPRDEGRVKRGKLIKYIVPEGFFSKKVKMTLKDGDGEKTIYNKVEKSGKKLSLYVTFYREGEISVFIDDKYKEKIVLK